MTEVNILQKPKRVCYGCGSEKTYVDKRGYTHWYGNGDTGLSLCLKCFMKYISNPKWHPIWNPITSRINNRRRVGFKGKQIYVDKVPRTGVCSWCGAVRVVGEQQIDALGGTITAICKKTDLHHVMYDDSNPLAHTVELCTSCHNKTKSRERRKKRIIIVLKRLSILW
jgi:hypothetical protein